jgi:hypothetical protein
MEEFITRIQGNLELLAWSLWIVSITTGFMYILCTSEENIKEKYKDKNFVKKVKVITIISVIMAYAVTHLYIYLY